MTVSLTRGGVLTDNGIVIGRASMTAVKKRNVVGESKKGRALIATEPVDFTGPVNVSLRKQITSDQLSQVNGLCTEENLKAHLLETMCVPREEG